MFLDSALRDPRLGRYSFLTADPFELLHGRRRRQRRAGAARPTQLQPWPATHAARPAAVSRRRGGPVRLRPGAQPGAHCRRRAFDEFSLPALAIGLYDVVLAFDHVAASGLADLARLSRNGAGAAAAAGAASGSSSFRRWLQRAAAGSATAAIDCRRSPRSRSGPAVSRSPGPPGLSSNFSAEDYRAAVQRAIDYIHAGDCFKSTCAAAAVSRARRRRCRSTCGCGSAIPRRSPASSIWAICRSSAPRPSGFSACASGRSKPGRSKARAAARPGPRPICSPATSCWQSEKDRAENVMIVDLLRNDLSRVCAPDSVRVTQLCGLEIYQFVQHLVSVGRRARCAPGSSAVDLLRAAFPGGSITGAPKVRAMEIIAELEPTARGPYCGSLGYFGFDGSLGLQHPDPHDHRRPRLVAVPRRRRHRRPIVAPSANTKKPGTKPKACCGRWSASPDDPAHRQLRQLRPQPGPLFPAAGAGDARRAQRRDRRRPAIARSAAAGDRPFARTLHAAAKRAARSRSCASLPAGADPGRLPGASGDRRGLRRRRSSARREPMHGRTSLIRHNGKGCFADLPNPLTVGRYHSLVVDERSLPAELEVTARTEDGVIMALAHRQLARVRRAVSSRVDSDRRRLRIAGELPAPGRICSRRCRRCPTMDRTSGRAAAADAAVTLPDTSPVTF